jgi:hypothetical protein
MKVRFRNSGNENATCEAHVGDQYKDFSIFETLQSSMDGDVRQLKELRLWEISVVTFPMNESAQIQSVKSLNLSDDEVQHHLRGIARHQKGMRMHLKALLGGDDLDDAADDPALLEDDDSEAADVESKALLLELQKLVCASRWTGERLTFTPRLVREENSRRGIFQPS